MPSPARPDELVVLGDLHGHFDDFDRRFLEAREAALCVFVGDLGDEDPEVTRRVAAVGAPSRVLLGNHDAWESFRFKRVTPALQACLDALGDSHFAYRCLDMEDLGVSLIGCRPFSWGGPSLRSPEVYNDLYGVETQQESAQRIVETAGSAEFRDLVLIAHNGPRGLGGRPQDIYGKDFGKPGGDWGDLDLRIAIRELKAGGFRIPLVIAGHMHHRLSHPAGATRRKCVIKPDTVYVNPARVPRIFFDDGGRSIHHYLSVRIDDGELSELKELYVHGDGIHEELLFARETA